MSTTRRTAAQCEVNYPTSDGRPMAETDLHRGVMINVIQTLQDHFADNPKVYVTGNLLLFYEEGNRRRHISPDVFVVFGVDKEPPRRYYLLWKEGKGPDVVVEITSASTRREDQKKKRELYRDVLKVPEYFQFDPTEDYLEPSLQGHRLRGGEYEPIELVAGRLPSALLGLHLERDGTELRLYDPATGQRLLTRSEKESIALRRAERAEAARRQAEAARQQAEAENEQLRRELEALRRSACGEA